jgi:hypothetical protein
LLAWGLFLYRNFQMRLARLFARFRLSGSTLNCTPTIGSPVRGSFPGIKSYLIQRLKPIRDCSMTALPVDRALRIYDTLANRSETRGAREGLSKHLMEKYFAGEKDQHRLTVEGLSYLRSMYRALDSQN